MVGTKTLPQSDTLNRKAKVGVFMPCYNMGKYINGALDSLYAQTFQDFVVIIADDASPQKSTLNKLSKIKYPRCRIYYENKNMGLIKISNKYMSQLDAEYIVLFNPDDKMHPDFLAEQVSYLDSHTNTQAVSTWVQEFDGGDRLIRYDDKLCSLPYMLVENNFSGAALMRKSAWIAAGKHDTDKGLYPNLDYDLWLSMLEKGFKLGTIHKPLFYWRVRQSSLSHDMDADKMLTFRKALFKKYSDLYYVHSNYVVEHYIELLSKFEEYYFQSMEGHDWLDSQYKRLTRENTRLNQENTILVSRVAQSINLPYMAPVLRKLKRRFKRS